MSKEKALIKFVMMKVNGNYSNILLFVSRFVIAQPCLLCTKNEKGGFMLSIILAVISIFSLCVI